MHRRSLTIIGLLVILALPLSASQFMDLPFEQVATESQYIVRGTMGQTWSAWDDAHEVIYTYATIRVNRYFGEATGPDTLMIREVGGTVDGYTQEAIGFPMLRSGEDVVLMLSQWEDGADYRIHAFNQGKYIVSRRGGREMITADPFRQGEARQATGRDGRVQTLSVDDLPGLSMDEFAQMVIDARAGRAVGGGLGRTQQQ
ncbi:MAG TPA: hypothetical protein VFP80_08710 [Thermoanaerobaculia bacterium]|nr:hypothetical protein [Thermoanaerobaculia bacterium]